MADTSRQVIESEDLDYHITFPSPLPPECSEESDADDVEGPVAALPRETKPEPVVILLGWMGCQDKNLAKYSEFYVKHGCITIRYSAATEDLFRSGRRLEYIASKVLELIQDMDLEENPVTFHIFSNGGGFIYRYISKLLHTDKSYAGIQVKGCVLDSSPCPVNFFNARQALMESMQLNIAVKHLLALLLLIYLSVVWIFHKLGLHRQMHSSDYWSDMENDRARWPQLFLYSKADNLVPYQDIDQLVEYRRKLGVKVWAQCWDDSTHVKHYRTHREAYIKQCYDFLDTCLEVP